MNNNSDLSQHSIVLLKENQLNSTDHHRIQNLLVASYSQYADIFTYHSYWGARPDYRLLLKINREIIAHLDFELRNIKVGSFQILIAGVGEVATHPQFQNKGFGHLLMKEL